MYPVRTQECHLTPDLYCVGGCDLVGDCDRCHIVDTGLVYWICLFEERFQVRAYNVKPPSIKQKN